MREAHIRLTSGLEIKIREQEVDAADFARFLKPQATNWVSVQRGTTRMLINFAYVETIHIVQSSNT